MKKFFVAFLGTMAGIWLSLFIAVIGIIIIVAAAGVSSISSGKVEKMERHSYLSLNLSGEISDRPKQIDPIAVLRDEWEPSLGVNEIVGALDAAADDDRIDGVAIYCNGSAAGLAQRQAIVEALKRFKDAAPDKWVYAYGDTYVQGDYYVASVADSIFLNPIGQVYISGLSTTNMYFKGFLDKIGVEMEVVKVGTYKSAVEPYILNGMSEPAREQMTLLLDNMWGSVSGEIAANRNVAVDSVNAWANSASYALDGKDYVARKVVDRLVYRHEFDEKLAELTDKESVKKLTPVTVGAYCKASDILKKGNGKGATIAVLYACGEITDETGNGIVAKKLVPQILELADDKDIDGLVMYVNSGGGSAFASEQIWEALEQWKELTGKPFYVSMSDYAASGGYYISCGADRIYAQPTTLTGSIGIFGLIPNFHGLMADKLGINTSTVATNPSGAFPTTLQAMTPVQRAAMQGYVDRGYDLFTSRCAQGRHMSQDSIKAIAEGRVWDGREALKLGLVDEIGGLDMAIAGMASKLNATTWTIVEYPVKKEWYESLLENVDGLKASIVRGELGELAPAYDAVNSLKTLAPMQARMDNLSIIF